VSDLIPYLLQGLATGLLYALMALGFMLIVGVMQVINLAHGALFALGAYVAVLGVLPRDADEVAPGLGLWAVAVLVAPLAAAGAGAVLELGMRRTYGKDALYGLLFTFGAAIVIEEGIRLVWQSAGYGVLPPAAVGGAFTVGGVRYLLYQFVAAGVAGAAIVLLWLFIERTRTGALIKAGAHDAEMVRALGVDLGRLRLLVFALGCGLAGLAGVIMAPLRGLRPHMGADVVIPAFVIIVLGGVGSFRGSVVAGLLVGVVESVAGRYVTAWSQLAMYLLLIAVVVWRPRGLSGRISVLER